jgi:hypothetical protein
MNNNYLTNMFSRWNNNDIVIHIILLVFLTGILLCLFGGYYGDFSDAQIKDWMSLSLSKNFERH